MREEEAHTMLLESSPDVTLSGAGARNLGLLALSSEHLEQTPKIPEAEYKPPLLSSRGMMNHAKQAISLVPKYCIYTYI